MSVEFKIHRGYIPWAGRWYESVRERIATRDIHAFDKVAMYGVDFATDTKLVALAKSLFGSVGVYHQRILVKDERMPDAIPLHQDAAYHRGWTNKASFFVALTKCDATNGTLVVYPGTETLGLLGDAGEIDHAAMPGVFRVSKTYLELEPGDVVVMPSMMWHESVSWSAVHPRVLVDVIYQPSDDPSTDLVIDGPAPAYQLPKQPMKNGRVQKLQALQAKVDAR